MTADTGRDRAEGPARPGFQGQLDVLVLGSGVAGLSAAVRAAGARGLRVGVLTKAELSQSATRWAQGGVAAVLGGDEDTTDLHIADTLAAGAGLCDVDAVEVLVGEGPGRVNELIAMGAVFDRRPEGRLDLSREGGHSTARVLHAGGAATGAEIERALVEAASATAAALLEGWFAVDLIDDGGRCGGVVAVDPEGRVVRVTAAHTLVATGGAGQVFSVTTNPREATGDGVAMALRAGVAVADVEFMQFHPTALHHPAMPRPLISEALRGHGASLRDAHGERFVDELSPRDVVSRAMASRMIEQGVEHLWLDATDLEDFGHRFPTIAASLREIGIDPGTDWLPIAPAAHYLSGGIVTDLDGASSWPGLWVAGEAACTGVHGANRLASNSLLEGMVFGARVVEAILAGRDGPRAEGAMRGIAGTLPTPGQDWAGAVPARDIEEAIARAASTGPAVAPGAVPGTGAGRLPGAGSSGYADDLQAGDLEKERSRLQAAMTEGAGVIRSAATLDRAWRAIAEVAAGVGGSSGPAACELRNLAQVASALTAAARVREESRGAHTRTEHPRAKDAWRLRLVHGGRVRA